MSPDSACESVLASEEVSPVYFLHIFVHEALRGMGAALDAVARLSLSTGTASEAVSNMT